MVAAEEQALPVESIREEFEQALERGAVVVTAPTGSGKSTRVPCWCRRHKGRVLVIEPRRVACRALAARVAELEGVRVGGGVGYVVRDEHRAGPDTGIVFATPGVVLQWLGNEGGLSGFATVVLDELHERGIQTDLLLAVLARRRPARLVAMSATLDGDRVARHLDGVLLRAEGRQYPVEVAHLAGETLLPEGRGLQDRVIRALDASGDHPGDVLVFLPGKAEIARVETRLGRNKDIEVLTLHGGLSLEQQARVFAPAAKRRVVLATNVAETSLTIPGIGVVIDSGLVRRTRYFNGRGFLALVPVAEDSAEQRAGRAGRTAPGVCLRLWSPRAVLEPRTPPGIRREDLTELLLAAAACGEQIENLPFLDPPRDHAVEAAAESLRLLGALDERGRATERGRRLFGLPLDAPLGCLLIEAEREGCLEDALDLAAALSADRRMFRGAERPASDEDDLRQAGCDGVALIRAVREGVARRHGLDGMALADARAARHRLRQAFGLDPAGAGPGAIDRRALVAAALRSDPRCAYLARRRKGRVYWGNGGTEILLDRESAVPEKDTKAVAVLSTFALAPSARKQQIMATCALPVTYADLVAAGLGRDRVAGAAIEDGQLVAEVERVYAGRVIGRRSETPTGAAARTAVAELVMRGELFEGAGERTRDRLEAAALFCGLQQAGLVPDELALRPAGCSDPDGESSGDEPVAGSGHFGVPGDPDAGYGGPCGPAPDPRGWIEARLADVGFESGTDLALLTEADVTAPCLPGPRRAWLDERYPRRISTGDARYDCVYHPAQRAVELIQAGGKPGTSPRIQRLPRFAGLEIRLRQHDRVVVLRGILQR